MSSYVTSGNLGVSSCSMSSRTMPNAMPGAGIHDEGVAGQGFGAGGRRARAGSPRHLRRHQQSGLRHPAQASTCRPAPLRGKSSAATAIIVSSRRTHCPYDRSVTSLRSDGDTHSRLPARHDLDLTRRGECSHERARVCGGRDTPAACPAAESTRCAVVGAVVSRPLFLQRYQASFEGLTGFDSLHRLLPHVLPTPTCRPARQRRRTLRTFSSESHTLADSATNPALRPRRHSGLAQPSPACRTLLRCDASEERVTTRKPVWSHHAVLGAHGEAVEVPLRRMSSQAIGS